MEKAHHWRIRFKRKDGYFTSHEVSRKTKPITKKEVKFWADTHAMGNVDIESVDEIYSVDDEYA